ncbi:hypothetical protein JCGZ_12803 [Jatropha curcas]|uniref:ZF-HD dimerization-type domain-containing protein n=1 Tax=Jatropha curcas TaxID=180498 RepID=A0A067KRE0_JATCU|nr:zinc-finger homeodomain protein 6 [Jatropha curcas]KDP34399.1 hypothetical protein JCGZ_12803 [Jatropha curcas]
MEVRGQEKGIAMPSSLGCNPTNRDSSSKVPSSNILSAFGETKEDDHHHHHQNLERYPLFHHHQMNLQNLPLKPTGGPEQTQDPTPAPAMITAVSANNRVASVPSRSSSRSPPAPPGPPTSTGLVRYRECLKNHAASKGGFVVDGCGEFMPTGEEGTAEALRCAACQCHRNFHRKEIDGEHQSAATNSYYKDNNQRNTIPQQQLATSHPPISQPSVHYHHRYPHGLTLGAPTTTPAPTIVMTFGGGGAAAESSSEDLNMFQSNVQGYGSIQPSSLSKKRFRTKFSQEQKEKMLEFAEKIEWKIQKQDEQEVQQFCSKVGVKRKVFKVWMHNNKQAMKKKQM